MLGQNMKKWVIKMIWTSVCLFCFMPQAWVLHFSISIFLFSEQLKLKYFYHCLGLGFWCLLIQPNSTTTKIDHGICCSHSLFRFHFLYLALYGSETNQLGGWDRLDTTYIHTPARDASSYISIYTNAMLAKVWLMELLVHQPAYRCHCPVVKSSLSDSQMLISIEGRRFKVPLLHY